MGSTGSAGGRALQGVRVLDLSQLESGATVTQALAWMGADVVKVEEPGRGDQSRFGTSEAPGVESHFFIQMNCNKRGLTLNLRDERGKELLRRMILGADVFVENFAPGTIERMGFSYEQVSALNPRIIYAQIKGFGPGSPYAGYLSYDMVGQAMGGIMSLTGDPGGPPTKSGSNIADTASGLHCLIGILAALYQRAMTGRGQRVEVAMQETIVNLCRTSYARQNADGRAAPRVGNGNPLVDSAPANAYPCRPLGPNDYCYVYCGQGGNRHWDRLLQAMGRADLLGDPRFSSPRARAEHAEEVDRIIGEWTRGHTKHEVLRILGEAGVPVGAVLDTEELSRDPYLRERGTFATVHHPVRGDVVVVGWPVHLSESPVEVALCPLLGQHTDEVLGEWLGLAPGEIERLHSEKVV